MSKTEQITHYYMDRSGDDVLEPSKPTNKLFERYNWVDGKYHGLYELFYESGELCVKKTFHMGKELSCVEYWPGGIIRLSR